MDRGARRLRARLRSDAVERGRGLAAQDDALAAAAQPVERGGRLLARTGRIGELLLGPLALGDQSGNPLVERATLGSGLDAARLGLAAALGEAREVERRDRGLQRGDLDAELLRPLGRRRLQRQRPQTLLHLVLEVACALDLQRRRARASARPGAGGA